MIVAVDTDVLVNWVMRGAPHHRAARNFIGEMIDNEDQLAIVAQTMHKFIHISTDARRFEHPLSMDDAIDYSRKFGMLAELSESRHQPPFSTEPWTCCRR